MTFKVFTVYDSKTNIFMHPFFMVNTGFALRSFEEAVNDPNTQFSKYPSDFTLFEMGEFNDFTGEVTAYAQKISLGIAVQFKKEPFSPAPLFGSSKER